MSREPVADARTFGALLVDFGGVLTSPMQEAMLRFATELDIELQDLARAALGAYSGGEDPLVVDFETGKISEEEFAGAFAERLSDICGRPIEPEGLVRRIFRLELQEDMFDLVGQAYNEGYKTALVSNSWGTELYPMDRLEPLFDQIVISGVVGLRKPDREIFGYTVEKLAVAPEQCVFVDDHPGHLKAAQAEGMTTVLHRTPSETIEEVRKLLKLS